MRRGAMLVAVVLATAASSTAQAAPLAGTLSSVNGEGRFDNTVTCANGGDGDSWRYGYTGAVTPVTGPLAGVWSGTVEVHDVDGTGRAFIPAGDGRLALSVDRGGTAHLEFGQGGCTDATLALSSDANGEPVATGTLPIHATAGDGTLRGLSGSGTATFSFGLGAGADNPASLSFNGAFSVTPPALGVSSAVPYYNSVTDFLTRKLTVRVLVSATDGAGDGYAVKLTAARLGASNAAASGIPAAVGRVNAGGATWVTVKFNNANPNTAYQLTTTVAGTDSIDAPVPPVTQTRSLKTPVTF